MSYLLPENDIDNVWDEMIRTAVGDPYWEPILSRWADRIWKENHRHKLNERFNDIHSEWFSAFDALQLNYTYLYNEKTPKDHIIGIEATIADQQLAMTMLGAELAGIDRRLHDATTT